MLKESGELDLLLPDLLLSMGIEPISHAQVGVRQYGVDVAAIKKKPNKKTILYLFTIKQGDLTRKDWDTNAQSIRPSLNEIKDVFIPGLNNEYKDLKKVIILCTSGIKKQEVEENWNGYVNSMTIKDNIEYDFWGSDKLAILIEENMFSENILPHKFQSLLRKTITHLSDNDYNLSHYIKILTETLSVPESTNLKSPIFKKKIKKNLRTIHLCLNILWHWAKDENNIKNSVLAGEKTILLTWNFINKYDYSKSPSIFSIYKKIYETCYNIYIDYIKKIKDHCFVENGLNGYSRYNILESLNVFDQLGIITIVGIKAKLIADATKDNDSIELATDLCLLTKNTINNHKAIYSPLYDNHIIEISQAILQLYLHGEIRFIEELINYIITHVSFAYKSMGSHFPISSDSFDDLVNLNIKYDENKESYVNMSTLIPILAQWSCVLDLEKTYIRILETTEKIFEKTTQQIWYPDKNTDSFIYITNAAAMSGAVDAPIVLHKDIEEMKNRIKLVQKNTVKLEDFSCVKIGHIDLLIMSSRHYRTPFLPQLIQFPITNPK